MYSLSFGKLLPKRIKGGAKLLPDESVPDEDMLKSSLR